MRAIERFSSNFSFPTELTDNLIMVSKEGDRRVAPNVIDLLTDSTFEIKNFKLNIISLQTAKIDSAERKMKSRMTMNVVQHCSEVTVPRKKFRAQFA